MLDYHKLRRVENEETWHIGRELEASAAHNFRASIPGRGMHRYEVGRHPPSLIQDGRVFRCQQWQLPYRGVWLLEHTV